MLIAIRLMMSGPFHAFEQAAIKFFGFAETIFDHPVTSVVDDLQQMQTAGISYIPKPAPLPEQYR